MSRRKNNIPISAILKNTVSEEDPSRKQSKEEWRKEKELEEARKAGNAPAATDEEGKDINPHIPQYISSTPWYFGATGPTLKHQRPQSEKTVSQIGEWYNRGQTNKVATKWRKGACENCGAMGHKRKDCFERPRKVPAKFNNANIAPDEYVQPDLTLDYDSKRDRWAGYDTSEHNKVLVDEFQKIDEEKKKIRAEQLNSKEEDKEEEEDSDADEDKYVDEVDMPGTKVDSKQRITVRNLRIREDTAKYLVNLNPNSAHYDPKSRSMRDNPYAGTDREAEFKGENAIRFSGDARNHANAQVFAWNAQGKGVSVNLLAEPTKVELLKHEFDKKKEEIKNEARESIIKKYGGAEHLDAPPPALLLAQTEEYIEYSRTGHVIKGQEKQIVRSRFEEDVFINNHTSVWGSYYQNGQWGYKCCHAFIKNSYCCGEAAIRAVNEADEFSKSAAYTERKEMKNAEVNKESSEQETSQNKIKDDKSDSDSGDSSSESSDVEKSEKSEKSQARKEKRKNKKRKHKEKKKNRKKAEKELTKDEKMKEALRKEEESQKEAERLLKLDERKRPYNSMYNVKEPTEEEKEAYQMKRLREEDPMAQFMN